MSRLQANQVGAKLHQQFDGLIDMGDKSNADEQDREATFLSRALTARALSIDAGATDQQAASAVTDGTGDNGLDAVHLDTSGSAPVLSLVQSKWHASGTGSITAGDTLKFLVGVRDLTDCAFGHFNDKVKAVAAQLETALDDPSLTIRLLIATSGLEGLAEDSARRLTSVQEEFNVLHEMVTIRHLTLADFYKAILGGLDPGVAELDVLLREWGRVTEPFEAYTGLVSVQEVAAWYTSHGDRLFVQNIRKSLGNTAVNNSIATTLREEPQNFWYYNNGVTVLCETIAKTAKGGGTRDAGNFLVRGVSIVNGAQTVASVARAMAELDAPESVDASVAVRFISLRNCPPGFSTEVTRATNTQNTVEAQDFVALDPEQVRLRQELALTLAKVYSIKRGELPIQASAGCSVTEATIALACFEPDPTLAVLAKSAIGRLYASTSRPPYRRLFNPSTSVYRLWRSVEVMRAVDSQLQKLRWMLEGREDAVALQGNRIVLHLVARRLPLEHIADPGFNWEAVLTSVPAVTESVLVDLIVHVERNYSGNYITSLFKNAARCSDIVKALAPST